MDAPDRPSSDLPPRASRGGDSDRAERAGGPAVPAELLERVAAHLRPVRGQMDAAYFDALVRDVAAFKLRWGETRRP